MGRRAGAETATQVFERLTPAERAAVAGWFLASYAPSTYARVIPLRRNWVLDAATRKIAQYWKGTRG